MLKLIRWAALAAVLLVLTAFLPLGAAADEQTEIRVLMPQTIQAGEQFAATIDLQHNTGWAALQFAVSYDTAQMKLVDVQMGEPIESQFTWFTFHEPTPGTLNVMSMYNDAAPTQAESGSMTANGTWATLIFAVNKDVAEGAAIAVNAKLITMVNAQMEEQLKPATFTGTAKVGALSAQDKRTQPSATTGGAVVSGAVTGVTGQFGTANNDQPKTTNGSKQPEVITSVVTNAAGQTEIVTVTRPATASDDAGSNSWLWILIGSVAVVAVAVVIVVISRKKK
ncbi:MAG: cohesin domain-containing protein [Acutalibacteraceae bacterium]|jgi:hypothetical protein